MKFAHRYLSLLLVVCLLPSRAVKAEVSWNNIDFAGLSGSLIESPGSDIKVGDKRGPMSYYWAQEMIGADLAKAFMKKANYTTPVDVGVYDVGYTPVFSPQRVEPNLYASLLKGELTEDTHGTAVANLFVGSAPYSVSDVARLSHAVVFDDKNYLTFLGTLDGLMKNPPRLVNISMYFSDVNGAVIFTLLQDKSLIVTSADNRAFDELDFTKRFWNEKIVVVGSVSPLGTISAFSKTGKEVTVYAPSDNYIRTQYVEGKISAFSGTSGATPLVTGSVANVSSIVPYASLLQLKEILKASSSPLILHATHPKEAGLLNSYRMVRLADRIHGVCESAWHKEICVASQLEKENLDSHLSSLTEEGAKLYGEALALLSNSSSILQWKGLVLLRTAFFLAPDNSEYATALAAFYEQYTGGRFAFNAGYFRSITNAPDEFFSKHYDKLVDDFSLHFLSTKARTIVALEPNIEMGIKKLIAANDVFSLSGLLMAMQKSSAESTANLLHSMLLKSTTPVEQRVLLAALGSMGTLESLDLLIEVYPTLQKNERMTALVTPLLDNKNPAIAALGAIDPTIYDLYKSMVDPAIAEYKYENTTSDCNVGAHVALVLGLTKQLGTPEAKVKELRAFADKIAVENKRRFTNLAERSIESHQDKGMRWVLFFGAQGKKELQELVRKGLSDDVKKRAAGYLVRQYFMEHPKDPSKTFFPSEIKKLLAKLSSGDEGAAYQLLYEMPKAKMTPTVSEALLQAGTESSNELVRIAVFHAFQDKKSNLVFRPESRKFREAATRAITDSNPWVAKISQSFPK